MATFQLTVVLGVAAGQRFDVPDSGITLGRSRMAGIQLSDNGLSRLHCRFYIENGCGMVQDLDSSNGTMLNGLDIGTTPTKITDGDCVTVGEIALRISGLSTAIASLAVPGTDTVVKTEKFVPTAASDVPDFSSVPVISTLPEASIVSSGGNIPVAPTGAPVEKPSASDVPLTAPNLFGTSDADGAPSPASSTPQTGESVNLGLEEPVEGEKKRGSLRGLIFALCSILILLVGALIIFSVETKKPVESPRRLPSAAEQPVEFSYERLMITEKTLFRYTLTYVASGELRISTIDMGDEERRFNDKKQLSEHAQKTLRKEIMDSNYAGIRDLFPEESADGVSLRKKSLTLVVGTEIWSRVAENVDNREFDALCERLELFARNELNVWATRYSVPELREMGREQLAVAKRYWEQRDMGDEKLFLAVMAYKKGVSALETLNPKPDFAQELTFGLREATELLDSRYEATAFAVDQALNTQRYERAAEELRRILRMIPDRDDERNQKAMDELLLIEKRYLRKGGR